MVRCAANRRRIGERTDGSPTHGRRRAAPPGPAFVLHRGRIPRCTGKTTQGANRHICRRLVEANDDRTYESNRHWTYPQHSSDQRSENDLIPDPGIVSPNAAPGRGQRHRQTTGSDWRRKKPLGDAALPLVVVGRDGCDGEVFAAAVCDEAALPSFEFATVMLPTAAGGLSGAAQCRCARSRRGRRRHAHRRLSRLIRANESVAIVDLPAP